MMSPLRMVYLALAIWGAVHPMMYFVDWYGEVGFSVSGLASAWFANAAVSGLAWDLIPIGAHTDSQLSG